MIKALVASLLAPLVAALLALTLGLAPPKLDLAAAEALQRHIDTVLEAHKWKEALPLIDRYLAEVKRDPIMLYNAACCHAQLGSLDKSANTLLDAVKAGFRDFDTMEQDKDLEPIREHDIYTAILEARDQVRNGVAAPTITTPGEPAAAPSNPSKTPTIRGQPISPHPQLDEWKREHTDKDYRYVDDPVRRIHYAIGLDDEGVRQLRRLIEREADHLATTLFDGMPSYATLIAVPTTRDGAHYFADPKTTGLYEHRTRSLVAKDIGESLQHEFVHLMHFGHMERLRQKHPIWLQEGIAALYESYELSVDGSTVQFFPNTRHNVARRAILAGTSMPWKDLFALSGLDFMERSQSLYPEVRSIFEFLADRGKLATFYKTYVKGYRTDSSGVRAMEDTFGTTLAEVERSWKKWMEQRGAIDDTIKTGDASLGISAADATDGVRIRETLARSAARAAGMRPGDIIVAIEGKAVRSLRELALTLGTKRVGDIVNVRFRRDGEYRDASVTLRPLAPVSYR